MKKFKEIVIPFLKSYDKCWLIIVGMIITSIIGKYFYEVGGIAAMILFPLVIVFIIALFKEQIWDRLMKKGTYELNDIIATMIGWLVSTILNIIWII